MKRYLRRGDGRKQQDGNEGKETHLSLVYRNNRGVASVNAALRELTAKTAPLQHGQLLLPYLVDFICVGESKNLAAWLAR